MRAVVLGGGFAGVLAAAVLARHTREVTVLESARLPDRPSSRDGLPQAYHSHLLVTGGGDALEMLLPGVVESLLAHGAHRRGLPGDALIRGGHGWFRRHDTGAYLLSASRWLTDWLVRRRALTGTPVRLRTGVTVTGLTGDTRRVTGVRVRREDGAAETLGADLVVDTTGRRSRAPHWLASLGCGPVAETAVDPGLSYATRVFRSRGPVPAVMVHPGPDGLGGTLFPIEGDRWIVTLTATGTARPPVDGPGFAAGAAALPSPVIADLIAGAEPIGAVRPFRGTVNRRRWFETGPRPDGFLVMGDALVAVNPVHSHGMSVAAMSALRMAAEIDRDGVGPHLQNAVAEIAARSWRMAVDLDAAPGPRPGGAELVARAAPTSPRLMTELFRAQTLAPAGNPPPPGGGGPPLSAGAAIAQFPELFPLLSVGRASP